MTWQGRSFLIGLVAGLGAALLLAAVAIFAGGEQRPQQFGSGIFTVYERQLHRELDDQMQTITVESTSVRPGLLAWGLVGGGLSVGVAGWLRRPR